MNPKNIGFQAKVTHILLNFWDTLFSNFIPTCFKVFEQMNGTSPPTPHIIPTVRDRKPLMDPGTLKYVKIDIIFIVHRWRL